MAKVIIIGSAYPLRGGGITTFNHRLAKEFTDMGHDCTIYSFSLQYPSFLFPGKTQYSDEAAPEGIKIKSVINSVNPFNWLSVGNKLKKENADLIVVRYWLPFMGPAFGTILRRLNKKNTKVICIADNVIPHEKRIGDKIFTKYFLAACNGFITMSEKVLSDLRGFTTNKPAILVQHPLYDNFGQKIPKASAKEHLGINDETNIILFFGFIRKYKGLDLLLNAFAEFIKRQNDKNYKLLIAGEFYEDQAQYQKLITDLKLDTDIILKTEFIPDNEVRYYLCAADVVVQPYKNATQSGVTPLAYNFETPMIVTNVGGLPDLVPHEKCGIVCEPNTESITAGIERFYTLGTDYFLPNIIAEKAKYSWSNLVKAIFELTVNSK